MLRVELAAAWEAADRGPLVDVQVAKVIKRPFSEIRFLDVSTQSGACRVVAKSTVRDPMNRPFWDRQVQATVEYEILDHLYGQFEQLQGLSVPRPLCVIPELDTFVMQHISGSELVAQHRALRSFSSAANFQALEQNYRALGGWLGSFQEFTKPGHGDESHLQGIVERIQLRLEKIDAAGDSRIPAELLSHVNRRMETLVQQAAGEEIPIAGRHGDFGPWNVMVSHTEISDQNHIAGSHRVANELVVLDFMGYAREPRPLDAINLLLFLKHESHSIVASGRRARALQHSFLKGLNWQLPCSVPLLQLCELHARVYAVWGCLSTPGHRWHHRSQQKKHLRDSIAWLLHDSAPGVWHLLQVDDAHEDDID